MLSIFTTVSKPKERGDLFEESLACYKDLADEVVVVNGAKSLGPSVAGLKEVMSYWPKEFRWPLIGQQFQAGFEACTSDWVLHADLDFIFHEKDFLAIREACLKYKDAPAISFYKYQFILPDRYNLKSRLVLLVNKGKYGARIRFDSGGDLCQPSLDGKYISPDDVPESKIPFYNYEKMLKTKEQIAEDAGRMERAYMRHFKHTQYGSDGTSQDAYDKWVKTQKGKFNKPQKFISLEEHPKYIHKTIKNLLPEQWGYDGHGFLERNRYA